VDPRESPRGAGAYHHRPDELDEQIEKVFLGVNEKITAPQRRGFDRSLNRTEESYCARWCISLAARALSTASRRRDKAFVEAMRKLPPDFKTKGDIHVFVTSATAPSRAICTMP